MQPTAANRVSITVISLLVLSLASIIPRPGQAEIYRYVDAQGHVHFSDRKLGPGYQRLHTEHHFAMFGHRRPATRSRFHSLILDTAEQYRLDPALVHAVITAESAYDPQAVSTAGAVGLMQLMPATAQRYGVQDRWDPTDNVRAGVRYLHDLLQRFQTLPLALAAYNAGENAVIKYDHQIPPYPETQEYVRRVLKFYRAYQIAS